jgi:hypothetical protein
MFQDPPDEEVPPNIYEEILDILSQPPLEPTISVDGIAEVDISLTIDELFDFDETIPGVTLEAESTVSPLQLSSAAVRSPVFDPPLSPFRRRSIEKYDLPGGNEDPFDEPSTHFMKPNSVQTNDLQDALPPLSSSKPIAITPPSRSFLADGLGIDDDDDEGGMKGLIERISLQNTRRGSRSSFADQRMLWDIPGDFYRSVPT